MASLDEELLLAHARSDHEALVHLYTRAADEKEALGNVDATCFFLTHAFVFALETNSDQTSTINQRLVKYDREVALSD